MECLSTSVKMKMIYNVYWKCTVFNVKEKMPEQENVSCKKKNKLLLVLKALKFTDNSCCFREPLAVL